MSDLFLRPVDPATGSPLDPVKISTQQDIDAAVARSRMAFETWRRMPVAQRAELMLRIADALDAQAKELGGVITSEMGRVAAESIPEVTKAASFFRYFARIAAEALASKDLDLTGLTLPEKRAWVLYEPRGVAAIIKPWNAPVQQIVWALAPALAAGCTAIVKPSEYTPHSALGLQRAVDQAGLPDGVVITLPGDGHTGQALVEADVDVVTFTGSIRTGRQVAEAAGRRIRKCILELSGKDALIVDEQVRNLDLVAAGTVYGAFSNCGHWCSSIERAYFPDAIADELIGRVVDQTRLLRVGSGDRAIADVGPVANRAQFEIVQGLVEDAVSKGARILTGGHALTGDGYRDGLFFAPTILIDVPSEARLTWGNAFGPVVAIYRYSGIDEALALANATNYGLGLSVWSDSKEFTDYVISRSDTGMVWVNEPLQSLAPCSWSVCKDSGIGVELGASGIREFTFEKVVQAQFDGNAGPRSWYFPYGR